MSGKAILCGDDLGSVNYIYPVGATAAEVKVEGATFECVNGDGTHSWCDQDVVRLSDGTFLKAVIDGDDKLSFSDVSAEDAANYTADIDPDDVKKFEDRLKPTPENAILCGDDIGGSYYIYPATGTMAEANAEGAAFWWADRNEGAEFPWEDGDVARFSDGVYADVSVNDGKLSFTEVTADEATDYADDIDDDKLEDFEDLTTPEEAEAAEPAAAQ